MTSSLPIKVLWHYGGRGSWCHTLIEFLLCGCEHHLGLQPERNAIIIVKADAVPSVQLLNQELAQFEHGVLIVTGNEEGTFDTSRLTHPRIKVWLQTPAVNQHCHYALPWGWTPREVTPNCSERLFDWSFAGQVTHERRQQCVAALRKIPNGLLTETNGFSQGLSRNVYWELLHSTKLVPCPSGPITVDSFRACEALEAGAIPILDAASPLGEYPDYWKRVFGDHPLPVTLSWEGLPSIVTVLLQDWDVRAEFIQAWWKKRKQEWLMKLAEDAHC